MVQTAQGLVTLGRFDITITVSTLSLYRVAPCKGHLEHMKQLYGYVKHFHMMLYIFESHEWLHSIYGDIEEELPSDDMPIPLGKFIQTSSFFDTNLYHNLVT